MQPEVLLILFASCCDVDAWSEERPLVEWTRTRPRSTYGTSHQSYVQTCTLDTTVTGSVDTFILFRPVNRVAMNDKVRNDR
jgi:UDP-glucose 4-epimerase